jgi:hypothetical protein
VLAIRAPLRQYFSGPRLERGGVELALLIAASALLELAAGVGLAYVAGFDRVRAVLGNFDWVWVLILSAALAVSLAGYYLAYQGIFRVDGGPRLSSRQLHAVVAAGFGGLLAHGGGALDKYALQAAGASEEEARARAAGLAGLEHGVLAIGACGAAIAVLVSGSRVPSPGFTLPWAIAPVLGVVIGFWAAEKYQDRFRSQPGWRGGLGTFLYSVHLIRELFVHPWPWGSAVLGMAMYWAADSFAVWAGLAAFGFRMDAAALIVGFGTGMVFTRRTAPLAGAGILALALPWSLWQSGAPLAVAVSGVFVYRILVLWLPLPVSLALLPTLREMGEQQVEREQAPGVARGRSPRRRTA